MRDEPRSSPSRVNNTDRNPRANLIRDLLSFDRRLTGGFAGSIAFAALASLLVLWASRAFVANLEEDAKVQRSVLSLANELQRSVLREFAFGPISLLTGDSESIDELRESRIEFQRVLREFRSNPLRPDLVERLSAVESWEADYSEGIDRVLALRSLGVGHDVLVQAYIDEVVPHRRALQEWSEQFVTFEDEVLAAESAQYAAKVEMARRGRFVAGAIVAFLLLLLFIGTRKNLLGLYRAETEHRIAAVEALQGTEARSTELRDNLERFHILIEEAPDAMICTDSSGIITAWNREASRLFEWPAPDALGKPLHELLLSPEHRSAFENGLSSFAEPGELQILGRRFEFYALRRDGASIPIEVSISAVRRDPIYFSCFVRDLRDRQRVQAQIRASEEQFRATFEFAGVGNVQLEIPSGRFFRANARMTQLLGYTAEELQSRTMHQVSAAEDAERVVGAVERLARGEIETYSAGTCLVHKNGRRTWVQVTMTLIRDANGAPLRVLAVIQDLSELRDAQAALRTTEERFQMMADSAPVLMWLSGADRHSTWFNRPWLEFTGRPLEDERGIGWLESVHPDDLDRVTSTRSKAFDDQRSFTTEFRLRHRAGEWRWMFDTGVPLYSQSGEFSGFVGSCVDITDRKREEAQREVLFIAERRAREAAEHAGRMKDEFLGTLSHELRTPLQAILGWARLIRSSRLEPEKLEQGLEVIERNTLMQKRLIDDLLDMSRIIQGNVRLDVRRVDLQAVIDSAIEVVRPASEAKGIEIRTDYGGISGMIFADAHRLQQVFWNLLSNAIKFTPSAGVVDVAMARAPGQLEVRVRDTGQGISAEFLPHVFERFRQGDASTTRRQGGLGLGLAIVRNLVELHGGSVEATSPGEGLGTTILVKLPVRSPRGNPLEPLAPFVGAGAEAPDAELGSPRLSGIRILVVDDERDTRELLQRVLLERGANVVSAGSMREALVEFRRFKPQILVSDIGMPEHDGYELIRSIRASEGGDEASVPAIALTAFARDEDRVLTSRAGFQLHLGKPVEPLRLVEAVAGLSRRAT